MANIVKLMDSTSDFPALFKLTSRIITQSPLK